MWRRILIVTMKDFPITEEGVYRFQLTLNGASLTEIEVPVLRVSSSGETAH